jgi:hypothetical protein
MDEIGFKVIGNHMSANSWRTRKQHLARIISLLRCFVTGFRVNPEQFSRLEIAKFAV